MIVFLIPIIGTLCITFIIYSFLKGRHSERMSIIEKGVEVSDINFGATTKWTVLRSGMLMIGLGLGLFLGSQVSVDSFDKGIGITAFTIAFGGFALVLNFWLEQKWRK